MPVITPETLGGDQLSVSGETLPWTVDVGDTAGTAHERAAGDTLAT